MKWTLHVPIRKISKILLAGAMGFTCLQLNNINIRAESTTLKDDATVKEALEIYFDEPVSQGTLIPNRGGGFGTTEEDNRWQQLSLPIGNSMMGANVYGEISKEHLTFNQKTVWNGGPSESRPDYDGGNVDTVGNMSMADYVKSVQDKFLNGEDASSMCNSIVGEHSGYGAYQSFGDIYLDFNLSGTATNYRRSLNLNDSLAYVDFTLNGTDYHREYLASYPDNVIAMKVTASGSDKLNFNVTFPIDNETSTALGKSVTTTAKGDTITVKGQMNDNQLKLNGQLKVITEDGTISPNGEALNVKDASEAIIIVSASTDYKNEYPTYRSGESDEELDARVASVLADATKKGYEAIKAEAIEDYTTIFDRVNLNLGQDVPNLTTDVLLTNYNNGTATDAQRRAIETTLFQYGRYLQIASSRNGDLPANLQGVWNNRVGDENRVPWASDYHMNVNLQMNYWPTYNTNMAECADPLIDYIDSLREPGRVTAETYFGVKSDAENPENGFTAHTQNTPFGWTCPGWAFSWGWSPAAVPWILQNCYEYYEYTGDLDYLRTNIYPMLKEEAKLYQQILREDPITGRLETVPAYSPEQGPYTAGNTYEQSLVWQLYKDSIEAAEALGVDADLVAQWKDIQSKLDPIEIGDSGQIKEWYNETTLGSIPGTDGKHRHMSHLLGLFPGDLISVDNEEYLNASKVSLAARGDDATGWGMGQRINSWARVGDGNHAYAIVGAFFRGGAYPNLWDAHAPFQIDGNFGYTAGVAEMLLQSNMGYVNLLPALPDAWAEGHVDGLVARGNFEISMDWSYTNLTAASILSKNGGDCSVQYPNIEKVVVKHNGTTVETTKDSKNRITFATEAGETYTIEEIPEKPVAAPTNAKAITDGSQVLIDFEEVATATEYAVYQSVAGSTYEKIATVTEAPYKANSYVEGATYRLASINAKGEEGALSSVLTPQNLSEVIKMDDRDSLITYSDGWGDWSDAGQYLGTEKFTESTGSSLEFYFSGTGLRVIGMKTTNTHKYDLYIDDKLVLKDVDTYATSTSRQKVLSETTGLSDGIHKARLYVSQAKISLDAFEIIRDVKPKGLSITSSSDVLNMNQSTTMQMSAAYTPVGAGNPENVDWLITNDLGLSSNIATIDETGLLTATGAGTVVVKAVDPTLKFTATKTITVTNAASSTKYDDRDASIVYGSGWAPWDESKHEFGTITETTTKGSTFSFDFTGTGVSLYFMKLEASAAFAGADIEVLIDGESKGTFSTFTTVAGSQPKQKVFETAGLSNTTHTVKVIVGDVSSSAPTGRAPKVSFDYYEVLTGGGETFNYTALKEEMQTYLGMDLSSYTDETRNAYVAAFEAAKALYETAMDQASIDTMCATLVEKREALKEAESESFIKTILANTIAKAEKAQTTNLAPAVQASLVKYLAEAKVVYEKEDATVSEVLTAWNNLARILQYLDFTADKAMLKDLIDECNAIDLNNYTVGVEEFKAALKTAQETYDDESALQARIDATYGALSAAKDGLNVSEVNKAGLKQLIDIANATVELSANYKNDDNWTAFTTALAEATDVFNSTTATQSDVNTALITLATAYENIRLLPSEDLLKQLEDYVILARSINANYYSAENYAFIQTTCDEAVALLSSEDYTAQELETVKANIAKAYAIINDEKIESPVGPGEVIVPNETPEDTTAPEDGNTTSPEEVKSTTTTGTTKPATGDTTSTSALAFLVIAAGACFVAMRKRKM